MSWGNHTLLGGVQEGRQDSGLPSTRLLVWSVSNIYLIVPHTLARLDEFKAEVGQKHYLKKSKA